MTTSPRPASSGDAGHSDPRPPAVAGWQVGAGGVTVVAALIFLALMGIGGRGLAWAALGLWLVAVAGVTLRSPSPPAEDA